MVSLSFIVLASGSQMDFSQVSGTLMTPPISPAAIMHRGSVINQGPMAARPFTSSSSSSLSSTSSCLSSIGALTQSSPCSSYPETLYHCLPQSSSAYFPPSSQSSTNNYQPAVRSQSPFHFVKCILLIVFLYSNMPFNLYERPKVSSCLYKVKLKSMFSKVRGDSSVEGLRLKCVQCSM